MDFLVPGFAVLALLNTLWASWHHYMIGIYLSAQLYILTEKLKKGKKIIFQHQSDGSSNMFIMI